MANLPPYQPFPVLSDGRIALRSILPADLQDILDISYYDGRKAQNVEDAREMQEKIDQNYEDGNAIHWGITDLHSQKITGTCGYYRGFEQDAGELGFVLLPQYRGKGYMTAALRLAIDFGKNTMGLSRIRAITTPGNTSAIQLLERLHFIKVADLDAETMEYWYQDATTNQQ